MTVCIMIILKFIIYVLANFSVSINRIKGLHFDLNTLYVAYSPYYNTMKGEKCEESCGLHLYRGWWRQQTSIFFESGLYNIVGVGSTQSFAGSRYRARAFRLAVSPQDLANSFGFHTIFRWVQLVINSWCFFLVIRVRDMRFSFVFGWLFPSLHFLLAALKVYFWRCSLK